MTQAPTSRRSRRRIAIFIVLVIAALGSIAWVITSVQRTTSAMPRTVIPSGEVHLSAGAQQVFLVGHFWQGDKSCSCPAVDRARVTVTGPDGSQVATADAARAETWRLGDEVGRQIAAVDIPSAGTYRVETDYAEATAGDRVAFGHYQVSVWRYGYPAGLAALALLYLIAANPFGRLQSAEQKTHEKAQRAAASYDRRMAASIGAQLEYLIGSGGAGAARAYLDDCVRLGSITPEQRDQLAAEHGLT